MSNITVSVSRYSLTVNTAQTFESLSDVAENDSGSRLFSALNSAQRSTVAYAAPAGHVVTDDDVRPDTPELPTVSGHMTSDVLAALESAGYLTTRTELVEQSGDTYLSEGRSVTAVHVLQPFTVAAVEYGFSRAAGNRVAKHGHAYADQQTITDRSEVVPAGQYLVGEINEYDRKPELVCVVGMNELSEDVVAWLYELDGFAATTCLAGCATCGSQWCAQSGSWTFQPDECDAEPWAFDDAEDFSTDMIACPACSTGRVGFTVY
jgi:hypothetical protein